MVVFTCFLVVSMFKRFTEYFLFSFSFFLGSFIVHLLVALVYLFGIVNKMLALSFFALCSKDVIEFLIIQWL